MAARTFPAYHPDDQLPYRDAGYPARYDDGPLPSCPVDGRPIEDGAETCSRRCQATLDANRAERQAA